MTTTGADKAPKFITQATTHFNDVIDAYNLANNGPEDLMDIQTLNEITEEEFDARLAVVYSSSDEEWMEDFDKYLNRSIPAQKN